MRFLPLLLIGVSLFSVQAHAQGGQDPLYRPHVAVGGKIGSQRDIGETEVFLPILQKDDSLLYGDIRLKDESGSGWEMNAGIGYRKIYENDVILGAYVMGDQRETENDNRIRQVTLGAEAMTEAHDLRLNIYLPERSKKLVSADTSSFQVGTQVFIEGNDTYEQAAPGFDVEVGQKIPVPGVDLRLFAAGYHFNQPRADDMTGGRMRLRVKTDDFKVFGQDMQLQFDAEAQHDNIRDSSYFAGAKLVIPFGKTPSRLLTPLQTRMSEIPYRDIDIVVSTSQESVAAEPATAEINGQTYTEVHELDVVADPNIAAAVAALPDQALVRIKADAPQLIANAITLKDGQALIGSDRLLTVRGSSGSRSAVLEAETVPSHLIKANGIGAGNPLIILPNGGSSAIYDLVLTNQNGTTGDANVMISNLNNPISSLHVDNVSSDGAIVVDTPSGSSQVSVDNSFVYGVVLRTRNNAAMEISLDNSEFRRSHAVALIFPQNITSSVFIEAMNNSAVHVTSVSDNVILDEKAPIGGRATLGLGFLNSSSVSMIVDRVVNNQISRTGAWDAGAILSQGVGGDLILIGEIHDNSGDDFTAVSTHANIGEAGHSADAAGFANANNGMVFGDFGGNVITNTP